jgi:hypothetical protein
MTTPGAAAENIASHQIMPLEGEPQEVDRNGWIPCIYDIEDVRFGRQYLDIADRSSVEQPGEAS